MAARLTEQEVHAACADFAAQGERPTALKLLDALGRGSLTTITKYLNSWNQSDEAQALDAESLPAIVQLPDELTRDGEELLKKIWNVAKGIADREIQVQREALKQAEKDSQARVEDAFAFSDAQAMKIERLEDEIKTLKAQLDDVCREYAEIEDSLAKSEKINVGLEKDKEHLEKELSAATTRVAEQQGQIKSLDQQLYKLQSNLESISESNKTLTADYKTRETELSKRTAELEKLRGRHASTVEDLAETKKQLNAANKVATDAEKRIAKLGGQLETYQSLKEQKERGG